MIHVVALPDVGEGVAEAELVEWRVAVGDVVSTETPLAEVLTDKATVEIYSPVAGTVAVLHGEPGDVLAVGGSLVSIELDGDQPDPPLLTGAGAGAEQPRADHDRPAPASGRSSEEPEDGAPQQRPTASPAVRARARTLGIELASVDGTGPNGRVEHSDLDRVLLSGAGRRSDRTRPISDEVSTEPVRGLRRVIAERLATTWSQTPHITYVEQVDATELLELRDVLAEREGDLPKPTLLPFVIRAVVAAVADQPRLNSHYSADDSTLSVFDAVHLGVATHTPAGLVVPVVRHAETRDIDDLAAEIARLAEDARAQRLTREELTGSTITVTSLGPLGGRVTTPILNSPEVTIVGINRLDTVPIWSETESRFVPRRVFNISASFDHRIVDGWDAAVFVQRLRTLLQTPALLFL